jgi:hypothetical protein
MITGFLLWSKIRWGIRVSEILLKGSASRGCGDGTAQEIFRVQDMIAMNYIAWDLSVMGPKDTCLT